jgi:hypothetical protein
MEETRSAGLMSVSRHRVDDRTPFEGSPSSFKGCDVEVVREWAAHFHGVDIGLPAKLPHSAMDGRTGGLSGTASGYDSQAVSEGRRGGDSPLTRAPAACQSI